MVQHLHRPLSLRLMTGAFLTIWLLAAAFPFFWTVWGSFKVEADFFSRISFLDAIEGTRTQIQTGGAFTLDGYHGAWVEREFWRFFQLNIWGVLPTTIIVLVAINQPFTLWMLHSFFLSIPKDLDESALVDGCTRFQAFRLAVMPVMWPGVITTGLFSFLLAYNDFAVTSMLLSQDNQTMIPKIASFLGSIQDEGNVMYAVAAVVSATVPLFILVLFFQRQIVSGLTAGAVKG